jgi:hypothetical protein
MTTKTTARRRLHRQAVLWVAAAFALGQLALGVSVDRLLPEVRDPEFAARLRRLRERIAEAPDRRLVLMLGSSRAQNGFAAGILSGDPSDERPIYFNFAVPGGGPFIQRVFLDRLRAAGIRPDVLLIEAMPAFFNHQRVEYLDQILLDGARLSAAELALLAPYAEKPWRPLKRWLIARTLPADRHRAELAKQIGIDEFRPGFEPPAPDMAVDGYGWLAAGGPLPTDKRSARTALAYRQYDAFYRDFRLARGPAQALRDVLTGCRAGGIEPVIVIMPEAGEFRTHYTVEARTGVNGFLSQVRDDFGVPMIDARDWVDDDGFTDGHHLHSEGALVFTKRFEQVIVQQIQQ